jgi:hypothetical protein
MIIANLRVKKELVNYIIHMLFSDNDKQVFSHAM